MIELNISSINKLNEFTILTHFNRLGRILTGINWISLKIIKGNQVFTGG
jgi:hypothetical protein